MAWRHEHIETIKQILKQKFKKALTKDMSIDECTATIRRILQEERKALYEKTNYSVYFKSFTTYDNAPSVRINFINEYDRSEKLGTIDLSEEPSKPTEPTEEQTKAYKDIEQSMTKANLLAAKFRNLLIGCFKFNPYDLAEMQSIKETIENSLKNNDIHFEVISIGYEKLDGVDWLVVELYRKPYLRNQDDILKVWVDVRQDNCSDEDIDECKPDSPNPYGLYALEQLSIEQFRHLIENIQTIKESLK